MNITAMKKRTLGIALCAVALLTFANIADAQNNESYVSVTGWAEKEAEPDTYYMNVDINELDTKGRIPLEQQQNAMLSALKKIGVDTGKQLKRLSLQSDFYSRKSNMASASYQLKLNSAEQVAAVWEALDGAGISSVYFVKAECSTIEKVKDEARKDAVRDARDKAASMAGAIDQKIGKCTYLSLSERGDYSPAPRMTKSVMMTDNSIESTEETIDFGKIKISVTISAKFILE